MKRLVENQTLIEPIEIKTFAADYILETDFMSKCDICEQNGRLYVFLEAINIYLPIKKSKCE